MKTSELSGYGVSVIFLALTAFAASPARAEEPGSGSGGDTKNVAAAQAKDNDLQKISLRLGAGTTSYKLDGQTKRLNGGQAQFEYNYATGASEREGEFRVDAGFRFGQMGEKTTGGSGLLVSMRNKGAKLGLAFGGLRTDVDPTSLRVVGIEVGPALFNTSKFVNGRTVITGGFGLGASRLALPAGMVNATDNSAVVLGAMTEQNIRDILKLKLKIDKGFRENAQFTAVGGGILGEVAGVQLGAEAVYSRMQHLYSAKGEAESGPTGVQDHTALSVMATAGGVF